MLNVREVRNQLVCEVTFQPADNDPNSERRIAAAKLFLENFEKDRQRERLPYLRCSLRAATILATTNQNGATELVVTGASVLMLIAQPPEGSNMDALMIDACLNDMLDRLVVILNREYMAVTVRTTTTKFIGLPDAEVAETQPVETELELAETAA